MSRDEPKPRIDAADTELPADAAAVESSSMSEELGAGSVAEMEKRLGEANRKAEENWDRFVRAQAEIENVRRRAEKDLQNAHKFALERFAKELLAVVDSLELGLQAAGANEANADGLREGMELTLKQLSSVLERFDVKPIDPKGERFNPEFHQAMATETDNQVEPNTVVRVFQKGYLLHDRLLRPALVVVAQRAPVSVGGEA